MTADLPERYGIRERVRHLRVSLTVIAVATIIGAVVSGLADGWPAAAAFAAGTVLVAVSYTLSTLAIAWADKVSPQLVFPVGVGMYIMKFSMLGVVLISLYETEFAGQTALAMGIVTAVLAWTTVQIWWTARTAHPFPSRARR